MSQPMARTSMAMCGADWTASTTLTAPTARAAAQTRATSLMVPRKLLAWPTATSLVRGPISVSRLA